jgi:hypothetical protein
MAKQVCPRPLSGDLVRAWASPRTGRMVVHASSNMAVVAHSSLDSRATFWPPSRVTFTNMASKDESA